MKFIPFAGNITLNANIIKRPEDLSVNDDCLKNVMMFGLNKTFLEMSIVDTGLGIEASEIPNLFKLFGFLDSTK